MSSNPENDRSLSCASSARYGSFGGGSYPYSISRATSTSPTSGWSKYAVEKAFRFAFENIKPIDGVIVGMYPRFSDEISQDVEHVRKYGALEKT